ncbi:ParB/RepB/Spo0J family partition protein [Capillimicrobium parvum]|uniref:Nucleoid occlusion protein n=1 Tax=Capillimicrobium parvum TaxID=2884022 RepID=A0A9E6Y3J1_9ACTN|nr:ParB/RepB/Spo0J family partition protein [Capillimicrobium parvum]UGS39319.1 Nucleoid occlusion protein [Capillimicrobium parvum]
MPDEREIAAHAVPARRRSGAARGMGRGLSAILSVSAPAEPGAPVDELRELHVDLIAPNPRQPRRRFEDETLQALAGSVRERGVLQPVLVRPLPGGSYELVAGERRWRAAKLAGLETVPALVRPREDAQALEVALIENMAREDLNPIEEAHACAALVEELGLTREEVGRRVGRSRVAVSNLLRLLDLPDEAIELIEAGHLSEGHGRALLLSEDHADRRSLARSAAAEGWSVRVLEARARESGRAGRPEASGASGTAAPKVHPDQAAAAQELADALSTALGHDVHVRAHAGGYRAELRLDSLDSGLDLAARLRGS